MPHLGTLREVPDARMRDLSSEAAHLLGARHAWLVVATRDELLRAICDTGRPRVIVALGGVPVSVADIRAQASRGSSPLVVDVTEAGLVGCPAVRFGADVAFARLEARTFLVAAGGAARDCLPGLSGRMEHLATPTDDGALSRSMDEDACRRWRVTSDAASVIAHYLSCHPIVAAVRYPGLRGDPCFEVAARTLVGGFGATVCYELEGLRGTWESVRASDMDPREQVMALEVRLASRGQIRAPRNEPSLS